MIRFISGLAGCCGLALVLVAGDAGAMPLAGATSGLSGAGAATGLVEQIHECHHTCQWDDDGMHYHGPPPRCRRHTCYIQHRPPHHKDEVK